MGNFKLFLTIAGIALVVIFSIQNAEQLTVNFLFWSFELRRVIVLFLVLVIGIVIGWTLHGWPRATQSHQERNSTEN